jgi:hypothetical protein
MFEFLLKADADDAVAGVHSGLRRITHRELLSENAQGSAIKDQSPVATELGLKIVSEIERTEQRPLRSLTPERAHYYKTLLATLAQNLARKEFDYDAKIGRDLLKEWRQERLPNVSVISLPQLPLSRVKVWGLGLYFVLGSLVIAYLMYALWPTVTSDAEFVLIPTLVQIRVSPETRLLLLAMVGGALGAFIHTTTSFTSSLGNRMLTSNRVWWFLLQPFTGMLLAVVGYFIFRTGFLSVNAQVQDINFFGVAALSALIGMFSPQAVQKLEEVFRTIFQAPGSETKEVSRANVNGSRIKPL